jgi:hypothetical protein
MNELVIGTGFLCLFVLDVRVFVAWVGWEMTGWNF